MAKGKNQGKELLATAWNEPVRKRVPEDLLHVRFLPWVGKNYLKSILFGVKKIA